MAQCLQRHACRDVVIGGPPFHGRHHLLTTLSPPLWVDDPLADPLPRRLKPHGAQLIRSRAYRRVRASGRQFVRPVACSAAATQPRRTHVEHLDARRDAVLAGVSQQPDIADTQRQRARQPQSCRRAEWPHMHRHRRRTDVQHQLAVQLPGGPQRDVDLGRVEPCSWSPDGVAAADVLTVHAPQVERDARDGTNLSLVLSQRLQTPHRDASPGMLEFVADADGARCERSGHDGPRPSDGERAVDPQPHIGVAIRRWQPVDQ